MDKAEVRMLGEKKIRTITDGVIEEYYIDKNGRKRVLVGGSTNPPLIVEPVVHRLGVYRSW